MKGQKGYAVVARPVLKQQRSLVASSTFAAPLAAVWHQLVRWHQLMRERRQLAMIDDAGLKDLGLSRATALHESERPFWDDPLKDREVK